MNNAAKLKSILEDNYFSLSKDRRLSLIEAMSKLENSGIHCQTCPGTCCTSAANSMLITPLEAIEILEALEPSLASPDFKEKLIAKLNVTITTYRLDKEIYTGKKNSQSLRKLYTCPFFNNGSLGCSLSRSAKPYGCLGFNPTVSEDNGKSCKSITDLLLQRQLEFESLENELNQKIKSKLNIFWVKETIPVAILELIQKMDNLEATKAST